MFTKTFFKFLFGFLIIVACGVLGAMVSGRYFGEHAAVAGADETP